MHFLKIMYVHMLALKIDTRYKKIRIYRLLYNFYFFAIIYLIFQEESKNTETKIKLITKCHPTAL